MRFCEIVSLIAYALDMKEGTYLITLFQKHLIVFTQSDAKDNRCYVLETMDPFFPLTSLATHIEHATQAVSTCIGGWWALALTVCSIGP